MNRSMIFSPILLVILGITACNESADSCLSIIVSRNVDWVEELLENCAWPDSTCKTHFYRGKYDNERIYFVETSGALCDIVQRRSIRDCSGNIIKSYGVSEVVQFNDEVSEIELLIQCE